MEEFKTNNVHLIKGDCLEVMKTIEDNSIDLILCDLPYGTTSCKWDTIIPFEPLWTQYNRIIKDNGAIVLFASQPFTTTLITSKRKLFKYCWYWIKKAPTGFVYAKNQPMRDVEEILVFYKKKPIYNPQDLKNLEKPIIKRRKYGAQGENYNPSGLTEREYKTTHTNYPVNTLYFKPQRDGLHPTQKPVELLKYLIRTYTNDGETILDNCMGSGSTGQAVIEVGGGRKFIGIELDDIYFNVACERIKRVVK